MIISAVKPHSETVMIESKVRGRYENTMNVQPERDRITGIGG